MQFYKYQPLTVSNFLQQNAGVPVAQPWQWMTCRPGCKTAQDISTNACRSHIVCRWRGEKNKEHIYCIFKHAYDCICIYGAHYNLYMASIGFPNTKQGWKPTNNIREHPKVESSPKGGCPDPSWLDKPKNKPQLTHFAYDHPSLWWLAGECWRWWLAMVKHDYGWRWLEWL